MLTGRIINGLKVLLLAAGLFVAAMVWLSPGSATVSNLDSVSEVSGGYYHTCAVVAGGVQCWGDNDDGQLGIPVEGSPHSCDVDPGPDVECSVLPIDVTDLGSGVAAVTAGFEHTCALMTSARVKCWGENDSGQLGDGTTVLRDTPVDVCLDFNGTTCDELLANVTAISAGGHTSGSHTCALMDTDGVKCWGENGFGQLGDGTTTDRLTPVDVSGLTSGVASIAAGGAHTCAVTTSAGLKCWGANGLGQLGDDQKCAPVDPFICETPVDVPGLTTVEEVITSFTTCALITGGGLKCWGYNDYGQVGDGTEDERLTPVDVCATGATEPCTDHNILSGIANLAPGSGSYHTCAVTTSGGLKCWGINIENQLGATSPHTCQPYAFPCSKTPIDVSDLGSGVSTGAVGAFHTCAIVNTDELKCWGQGKYGQVGDGTKKQRATPVDVLGPDGTDNDSDGCTDSQELGKVASQGGLRNPKYFWDFFDTWGGGSKSRAVDGFDISEVLNRQGTARPTPPTKAEAFAEALATPVDATSYHASADRDSPIGPDLWDLGPPNGSINGFDISFVLAQFGHTCAS